MSCDPGGSDLNLFDCLRLNDQQTVKEVYNEPADLVNVIVSNVFVAAGIILFLMVIFAGFKFVMSSQSAAKEDSKKIITGVVVGFLVMFSAYWIVQIVEIITGMEILF